jgi:hypothetical protein
LSTKVSHYDTFHPEGVRFYIYFVVGCFLLLSSWSMYRDRQLLRILVVGVALSGLLIWKAFATKRKLVLREDRMIIYYWLWPSKTICYDSIEACEHGVDVVEGEYGAIRVAGVNILLKCGKTIVVDRVREGTKSFFEALMAIAPELASRDES